MIAAIVPAAGRSTRMGRPKLLLPIGGTTVIARVVTELRAGGAPLVVVVAPPAEIEGSAALVAEAEKAGAQVIVPQAPTTDMRASIDLALRWLERAPAPDWVLLAPADSPGLTAEVVGRLIDATNAHPGAILAPAFRGRRGHPIVLPWSIATEIRGMPPVSGVNSLIAAKSSSVVEIEMDDASVIEDLDTPEDYSKYGNDDRSKA
jgi:molybdenum cofactor cytidylyltransferase